MKIFKYLLLFICLQGYANAQTFEPPKDITFDIPNITIPRDTPVNTKIDQVVNLEIMYIRNASCLDFTQTTQVYGTPVPGMSNMYYTNVPGIGVKFAITQGWNGGFFYAPATQNSKFYQSNSSTQQYRKVEYWVIDQVQQGVLTNVAAMPMPYMIVTYTSPCVTNSPYSYRADIRSGVTTVTPHTCEVSTKNIDVRLPDVKQTLLKDANSTAGDTNFSIGINCTAGSKVYITLTDHNDVANRGTTLTLNSNSTASGVGIELLREGKKVNFGPDSPVAGTTNQSFVANSSSLSNIPFTARYISKGNVKSGSVNATATFTMSYQ